LYLIYEQRSEGKKQPFNGYYTDYPVLAGTTIKNWMIMLAQRFTANVILLMAN